MLRAGTAADVSLSRPALTVYKHGRCSDTSAAIPADVLRICRARVDGAFAAGTDGVQTRPLQRHIGVLQHEDTKARRTFSLFGKNSSLCLCASMLRYRSFTQSAIVIFRA